MPTVLVVLVRFCADSGPFPFLLFALHAAPSLRCGDCHSSSRWDASVDQAIISELQLPGCAPFNSARSQYSRLPHNPYLILLDKSHNFEQEEKFPFVRALPCSWLVSFPHHISVEPISADHSE